MAALVVVSAVGWGSLLGLARWADELQGALPATAVGALAFVACGVVLSCLFVPFGALAGAAGLLLGVAAGTGVALAVAVVGGVVQLRLGSALRIGPWLRARVPQLERLDPIVKREGPFAILYLRLVGGFYVPLNYAAAATGVRARDMALGTAVGQAPRAYAYASLGGSLTNLGSPQARTALALILALAVGGALARRRLLRPPAPPPAPAPPSPRPRRGSGR